MSVAVVDSFGSAHLAADVSGAPGAPLDVPVAVIGAGPAGLMAAERLALAGWPVHVFDAMPSVGRKFLLAGKGGLNLTHAEAFEAFAGRYGPAQAWLQPLLQRFGAEQLRAWALGLGVDPFVGTSGRVFPQDMKAAPLLRAWLQRLRSLGVQLHMRHRWQGWDAQGALHFATPTGARSVAAQATVLALGGASWPRLGSDAAWVPWLAARGIAVTPLQPANCGFDVARVQAPLGATRRSFLLELLGQQPQLPVGWTPHFTERFAGQPFKNVVLRFEGQQGEHFERRGEFVATATGVEGSLVYAASRWLRDEIAAHGHATLTLDLLPDHSVERVRAEVLRPRGSRSLVSHLKSRLGLDGIKTALLYEQLGAQGMQDLEALSGAIKALPLTLLAPRPLPEAISTAGGVALSALDAHGQVLHCPGLWCAGEMLDWEAPTGGYLLTACCATGYVAGEAAAQWLQALRVLNGQKGL